MTDTHVDQVGGKHYAADGDQHWDVIERYDADYLLGNATKYLLRWRKKGTARIDLGKAASYIEKAIKCRPDQGARRLVPEFAVHALAASTKTHWMDRDLIAQLLSSGSHADLVEVLAKVREMEADAS